jgi:hypothetical protein
MLRLRKIDCYGQLILAAVMVLNIQFFFLYGLLIGLFLLSGWQILSAIFNTFGFFQVGRKRQILFYWKLCFVDMALLFLMWLLGEKFNYPGTYLFSWIPMTGAVILAGYYWKVYFQLIQFISLRNELDGLTKSKH